MTRLYFKEQWLEWFVIGVIAAFLLLMTLVCPARADVFPDLGEAEHYVTLFYGDGDERQAWYSFYTPLDEGRGGALFEGPGDLLGLEPMALYGWYRVAGGLGDDDPGEAQDHMAGVLYALDEEPGDWQPYVAAEQITLTTGPRLDRGYWGVGTLWHAADNIDLDASVWHDGTDGYRLKGSAETVFRVSSEVRLEAWLLIDADDPWGLWRATATHPMGGYDLVFAVEGSTRSDITAMVGVGKQF